MVRALHSFPGQRRNTSVGLFLWKASRSIMNPVVKPDAPDILPENSTVTTWSNITSAWSRWRNSDSLSSVTMYLRESSQERYISNSTFRSATFCLGARLAQALASRRRPHAAASAWADGNTTATNFSSTGKAIIWAGAAGWPEATPAITMHKTKTASSNKNNLLNFEGIDDYRRIVNGITTVPTTNGESNKFSLMGRYVGDNRFPTCLKNSIVATGKVYP